MEFLVSEIDEERGIAMLVRKGSYPLERVTCSLSDMPEGVQAGESYKVKFHLVGERGWVKFYMTC